MEYVYIPQPVKEKQQQEEKICPESTDDHWSDSVVNRGYFLTKRHAIEFLESHRAVTNVKQVTTNGIFTRINSEGS